MSALDDKIIACTGLSSGTVAYFLSQAGKRVLVLEKEQLPRNKTYGGPLDRLTLLVLLKPD